MTEAEKGKGGGEREKGNTGVSDMLNLVYMKFTFSHQSLGPGEQNTRSCVYPGPGDEIVKERR